MALYIRQDNKHQETPGHTGTKLPTQAQLISNKYQMLHQRSLNTTELWKAMENLSLRLCLAPGGAKTQ